jgi:hypothetical protein
MSTDTFNIESVKATQVSSVSGNMTAGFTVTLYEYQGNAYIGWSENFVGRVQLAVALYSGAQPSNAQNWLNATEVTNQAGGSWNTGKPWGTGYSASLLGANAAGNMWIYIGCNTPVTA